MVLPSDCQLEELVQFCINPQEVSRFWADPTFNIFDDNVSLTMIMYRNLKLENKATNQPPVFISPLLMREHKDCKTYPVREKCPNTEFFLVRIFLYADLLRRFTE